MAAGCRGQSAPGHASHFSARCSIAGLDALDELLHGRHETVGIERVLLEAEGAVAGEHQIVLGRSAMGDVLQRLLDAEAARVGEAPGGVLLIVWPGREAA